MRTITVVLCLFIILGFVNMPVSADVNVKEYEKYKDTDQIKWYIKGLGTGYSWANIEADRVKQKPLYCEPERLALTPANYIQILEDMINEARKKGLDIEKWDVELLLLKGLQKTFPCGK